MKKDRLNARTWASLLILGLFGQLAWTIENMYFNIFVYNTITTDPDAIASMVFWSALIATITTLIMGALSDKVGKRKVFMVAGYILWGLSTMSFAFISTENIAAVVGPTKAVSVAVIVVIIMDCVMTFFGSTANDAAFNAWVNDVAKKNIRGRVESVLVILPLIAMLIIFGGFDGLTQSGRWDLFFIIIGGVVTVGGILGIFFIEEPKNLVPGKENYINNITYGFLPSVIKKHPKLYKSLLTLAILGSSTQIFMPFLIIYIQRFLQIDNYPILLAVVLITSSILSVVAGPLIDKFTAIKFVFPSIIIELLGLILMFFLRSMGGVILGSILMIGGNMMVTACISGMVRNYIPKDKAGHFQGIRMFFNVLIPMSVGPFIGSKIIKNSGVTYEEMGQIKQVPNPNIFMASGVFLIILLIVLLLWQASFKSEKEKMEVGDDIV